MSDEPDESRSHRLATLRDRLDRGLGRRGFLRTLANASYALGAAHLLGVDDFLDVNDGTVPIVTALVRRDPSDPFSLEKRTREVPAEWYAAVTKAFELHREIAKTSVSGYLASAVEPGAHDAGTATISVNVSPSDFERASENLGSVLDRVSIDVTAVDEVDEIDEIDASDGVEEFTLATDVADGRVPGGVGCANTVAKATLAPALYDPARGTSLFATAQHAYDVEDDGGERWLFLPLRRRSAVRLGRVRAEHPVEDVAVVEPTDRFRPESVLRGPTERRVVGQYTRLGLADLAARDEELEKIGAMTDHTTGPIRGLDAVTCFTDDFCRQGQLKWGDEREFTDGDSGSVCFHADPRSPERDVLVAAFNNARTWWPGQNYVWGVSAYQLTENLGYHF